MMIDIVNLNCPTLITQWLTAVPLKPPSNSTSFVHSSLTEQMIIELNILVWTYLKSFFSHYTRSEPIHPTAGAPTRELRLHSGCYSFTADWQDGVWSTKAGMWCRLSCSSLSIKSIMLYILAKNVDLRRNRKGHVKVWCITQSTL